MIYLHPLAYLIGLQGVALLEAYCGEHDEDFTMARLADVRSLLDAAQEIGPGCAARPIGTVEGYADWAPVYDNGGNQLIDIEQPVIRAILDRLPVGSAVDVACGTGRHAGYLLSLGHDVIGVDSSPEMLAVARANLPDAQFHLGDMRNLPLPDGCADVVVCALALNHVGDLGPPLAEMTRVLRPGGHLVLSEARGLLGAMGVPMVHDGPSGPGYMPNWVHRVSDYLGAALPLGLEVRGCVEPDRPRPFVDETGTPPGDDVVPLPPHRPGDLPDIWALHPYAPEAANAVYHRFPVAIVWHFQKASG